MKAPSFPLYFKAFVSCGVVPASSNDAIMTRPALSFLVMEVKGPTGFAIPILALLTDQVGWEGWQDLRINMIGMS